MSRTQQYWLAAQHFVAVLGRGLTRDEDRALARNHGLRKPNHAYGSRRPRMVQRPDGRWPIG